MIDKDLERQNQELTRVIAEMLKVQKKATAISRAVKKWDRKNMAVCSAKVKKEDADAFKEVCRANGITRHQAIKGYIQAVIYEKKLYFW